MRPHIDATAFGSITIDGTVFEHDVVIATDGAVTKRKKKLSKALYGNAHTVSPQEAEYLLEHGPNADRLIVGTGQYRQRATLAGGGGPLRTTALSRPPTAYTPGDRDLEQGRRQTTRLFHVTC